MPDTIQIYLMDNRSVQAKFNGRPTSYEGGINIVEGESNATQFEIVSIPARLASSHYSISIKLTNAYGAEVPSPKLSENKFILPIGMAVAGYGQIGFSIQAYNESSNGAYIVETLKFVPLKIKVANTSPDWKNNAKMPSAFEVGGVETLSPGESAYARNEGTPDKAVLYFGIPQGESGETECIQNDEDGEISYTLEKNKDVTFLSKSIISLTLEIPDAAEHGFYSGANFEVSGVPTKLTIVNNSGFLLKMMKKTTLVDEYVLSAGKNVMLVVSCDGLNVYCNLLET